MRQESLSFPFTGQPLNRLTPSDSKQMLDLIDLFLYNKRLSLQLPQNRLLSTDHTPILPQLAALTYSLSLLIQHVLIFTFGFIIFLVFLAFQSWLHNCRSFEVFSFWKSHHSDHSQLRENYYMVFLFHFHIVVLHLLHPSTGFCSTIFDREPIQAKLLSAFS